MKKTTRPAIFKWRQAEPELILCAVRWYLRSSLSFRARGLKAVLTPLFDTQHGGFATGWVNVTMPLRYMRPGDASLMRATV